MRKFSPDSIHPNSVVNNPCQFFFWSINSPNVPYSRYMLIYTYIISIIIICLYVHVHIYHITVYILYSIHKIYDIYICIHKIYDIYICISNIYDIWYNIYIYQPPTLNNRNSPVQALDQLPAPPRPSASAPLRPSLTETENEFSPLYLMKNHIQKCSKFQRRLLTICVRD